MHTRRQKAQSGKGQPAQRIYRGERREGAGGERTEGGKPQKMRSGRKRHGGRRGDERGKNERKHSMRNSNSAKIVQSSRFDSAVCLCHLYKILLVTGQFLFIGDTLCDIYNKACRL